MHRFETHTNPVGHGGSSGVPQKKTVVREHPESDRPASAPARTTKRMEDVMEGDQVGEIGPEV